MQALADIKSVLNGIGVEREHQQKDTCERHIWRDSSWNLTYHNVNEHKQDMLNDICEKLTNLGSKIDNFMSGIHPPLLQFPLDESGLVTNISYRDYSHGNSKVRYFVPQGYQLPAWLIVPLWTERGRLNQSDPSIYEHGSISQIRTKVAYGRNGDQVGIKFLIWLVNR